MGNYLRIYNFDTLRGPKTAKDMLKSLSRRFLQLPVLSLRRSFSSLATVDASKLTIERTKTPKAKVAKETLKFGHVMSDHMLEVDW
jgi:hypothetical protein